MPTRRNVLATLGSAGLGSLAAGATLAAQSTSSPDRTFRIGIISASIGGKPQLANGHTWHFVHALHPTINLAAVKKHLSAGPIMLFEKYFRNPRTNFDQIPFQDTRITQIYAADAPTAKAFCEGFPGCQPANSVEELVKEVDAVWLGDASGRGEDHFDLVAPALERGLPTFCDKPIGGTVAGTRAILELARKHQAPLMSSSLFRHQWGTEEALRRRDSQESGALQYVIASQGGGYSDEGWMVYGQHPTWMAMTLCGPGVDAVSMYAYKNSCHALLTYSDRMPAEVWYGRPDIAQQYCHTSAHFQKETYQWTPAIEGHYWLGHHYQIFRMAHAFREMVRTRKEPVPHQEILEVTAIIHAAAKSLEEKSRLVSLAEVM